ncbi:MAG TPA: ImmA/IrrE family metallo-endopeptidase [Thermomicrobiales bacterium]
MTEGWLVELGDRFWSAAGGPTAPPRDLQGAVSLSLPVTTVTLPALALGRVERWLLARGIEHRFDADNRRLRGCLVATRGHGFVFVDGADAEDERRFTLAHEVAHFLMDYELPRERAIRVLGEGIAAVLDGERAPTGAERIDAALAACPLGLHTHLLARVGDRGARAAAFEARTDRLAWELLAPAAEVCHLAAGDAEGDLLGVLTSRYGLPRGEAERYARCLRRTYGPPPSFVDWLRG